MKLLNVISCISLKAPCTDAMTHYSSHELNLARALLVAVYYIKSKLCYWGMCCI